MSFKSFKFYKCIFKYLMIDKFIFFLLFLIIILDQFSDFALPSFIVNIIDSGIVEKDIFIVLKNGMFMLSLVVLKSLFLIFKNFMISKISSNFSFRLRNDLFEKIQSFGENEINLFGTSSILNRATKDVDDLSSIISILPQLIIAPSSMLILILMSINKSLEIIFLILIIFMIFLFLITYEIFFIFPKIELLKKNTDEFIKNIKRRIKNSLVIKIYGTEKYEQDIFEKINKNFKNITLKFNKKISIISAGLILLTNLIMLSVFVYGSKKISEHSGFTVGNLIMLLQYISIINAFFESFFSSFTFLLQSNISIIRIFEILNIEPEIKNTDYPLKINEENNMICLENISFSFKNKNYVPNKIIDNFSLVIKKNKIQNTNKIIIIKGPIGCGKSILIKLLLRFYDINDGKITFNDKNIKDLEINSLRERIGYAPQKSCFLNSTIEENLKLAGENLSNKDLINVLNFVYLPEFASDEGIKIKLINKASNISGGQKQKILIARLLLKKSPILIFDDSFSSIDLKTKSKIIKNILKNLKNKIIIATYDEDLIKNSNEIIDLENF